MVLLGGAHSRRRLVLSSVVILLGITLILILLGRLATAGDQRRLMSAEADRALTSQDFHCWILMVHGFKMARKAMNQKQRIRAQAVYRSVARR